jgi:hypothetical protein
VRAGGGRAADRQRRQPDPAGHRGRPERQRGRAGRRRAGQHRGRGRTGDPGDVVGQRVNPEGARQPFGRHQPAEPAAQAAGEGRSAAATHEQHGQHERGRQPAEGESGGEHRGTEHDRRAADQQARPAGPVGEQADNRRRDHMRDQQHGDQYAAEASAARPFQGQQGQRHPGALVRHPRRRRGRRVPTQQLRHLPDR